MLIVLCGLNVVDIINVDCFVDGDALESGRIVIL